MNSQDLQAARHQLETLARRLHADASTVSEQALTPTIGQRGGELSNVPFHLGDSGTEEFLAMMNATLLENELHLASEVRQALARINTGEYGICERCGQSIRKERLEAIPFVRLCIACAEQADGTPTPNLNRGRPATPSDTLAPEGEMLEQRRYSYAGANTSELERASDIHAAGTAGGGTAYGGLAGTNVGHGDPTVADLQDATGSAESERNDARNHKREDHSDNARG